MKKTTILSIFVLLAIFVACTGSGQKSGGEFRVHGTTTNPRLEGACLYLIAMDATIRDSVGIDSTFIKDGKFELSTTKSMMGILRVDMRHRYNIEDLLVVEEPGDLYVTIDSVSSGHGTPNNDALQRWKDMNMVVRSQGSTYMKVRYEASQRKDSITMKKMDAKVDSLRSNFKNETTKIYHTLDEGPLKEFFRKMYSDLD